MATMKGLRNCKQNDCLILHMKMSASIATKNRGHLSLTIEQNNEKRLLLISFRFEIELSSRAQLAQCRLRMIGNVNGGLH